MAAPIAAGAFTIRPLEEGDLAEAEAIYREAFRTATGIPDRMLPQQSYVTTRFRRDPEMAWAALDLSGKLLGSIILLDRGSLQVPGPVTLRPHAWGSGAFQAFTRLAEEARVARGNRVRAGFTFAHSPKHVEAMGKYFGGLPRYLSVILERPIPPPRPVGWTRWSALTPAQREEVLQGARALWGGAMAGLDLSRDILSLERQQIGETLIRTEGNQVTGLALCQLGAGTEAGPDNCLLVFGMVAPGADAEQRLEELLAECEALGAERGLKKLQLGVGYGRTRALAKLRSLGFKTLLQGISMTTAPFGDFLYDQPDVFVLDDWR